MTETISTDQTRDLWDRKAAFWDDRFGEGNQWHRELIEPATDRLLAVQAGETVLDIATGNGAYARHLARLGAQVTAFDFSQVFVECARARSIEYAESINYHVVDATDTTQLLTLGEGRFDAAVATMALMDIPAIDPLAMALPRLLKPGGRLVFSVQHPCFNSNAVSITAETEEREESRVVRNAIKVEGYLDVPPGLGSGMPGEPNPHYYFHRPLSILLAPFLEHGFTLTGLEEPVFIQPGPPVSWHALAGQIPPVLLLRLALTLPQV